MALLSSNLEPAVLVHGGAGYIVDTVLPAMHAGVQRAACNGYQILLTSCSVLDAVEEAVHTMEKDHNFNAGYGSSLTVDGQVEMDAAIMHGASLNAGCVSCVQDINSPVGLARRIMTHTPYKFIFGSGAVNFAIQSGIPLQPEGSLITYNSFNALQNHKMHLESANNIEDFATNVLYLEYGEPSGVGAVAIDADGNMAAATSTGGIIGKLSGCVGNATILGGGIYADNTLGAVVVTGDSEAPMRYNAAMRVLEQMADDSKLTAQEAAEKVLDDMRGRFNRTTGAICVDKYGILGIYHTTPHMPWAYQRGKTLHFGSLPGEQLVFELNDMNS